MVVVFTGGTGGAKLVQGLQHVLPAEELTVVVNTGDDLEWWGLHVSPDIDSVLYGLAGFLSPERGWGVTNDSFRCLERMKQLGEPSWFSLGDLDLATHLTRTNLLKSGMTLSQATREIAARMSIRAHVLPMSDDRVATVLETSKGRLHFQEYFVRERHSVEVQAVSFEGADAARPAPGLVDAIGSARAIVFAPSNPVTSIAPILAVPGIRDALRRTAAPVAAVSPIVGGVAVSGPAGELMRIMGWPSSIRGVGAAYRDFLTVLVADDADEIDAEALRRTGIAVACTNTVMKSLDDKTALAGFVLDAAAAAHAHTRKVGV